MPTVDRRQASSGPLASLSCLCLVLRCCCCWHPPAGLSTVVRTARPGLRLRRISSCCERLDACPAFPHVVLPEIGAPLHASSYTAARRADRIHRLSCCVAPALSSFHPSPWKVKPPTSPGPRLHLRPSLNLVRRTLNIISTRRSAPSRPKFSSLSHRNLCRSHPILAPATPYTPCPIQPAGAPIIATGAHDITSIPRFDSCCPPIRRVQHQLRLRTARVTDYRLLARHATNRKHGRKRCSGE